MIRAMTNHWCWKPPGVSRHAHVRILIFRYVTHNPKEFERIALAPLAFATIAEMVFEPALVALLIGTVSLPTERPRSKAP